MRKLLLALASAAILTSGVVYLNSSKAQNRFQSVSVQDLELASTIGRVTDRSPHGLADEILPDGSVMVDLQGRFQNVILGKFSEIEEYETACVTSVDEANAFFGRNLETGEMYPRIERAADKARPRRAVPTGMSTGEFEFYTRLIEDARTRRSENPNAATLAIVNNDEAGEGFNDPAPRTPEGGNAGTTLGQQRLNLFNFAAQIWGAYLDSSVTTNIRSQFDPQTCTQSSAVLGSAGSITIHRNFANVEFADTSYHAALANKIAGSDLGTDPEIRATFNSNIDNACFGGAARWYYGFDDAGPANAENLLLTVLHELGHGLGFSSFVNGTTGALASGFPDIYTRFMFDRTTGMYWHEMTDAQRQTSARNNGNVFWDGGSVRVGSSFLTAGRDAATGRVPLFTPTTLQPGSSISHFSTTTFPNLLMEPFAASGIALDLDLTRQQMRDIGWYPDSAADVVPDAITDIQPTGTALALGANATVTWTNGGGFNRNVSIDLSADGGTTFPITIASNIANTGTHSFTVPNVNTSLGRVRVREHNFVQPSGISAANLTIGSGGTPTPTPTPPATATPTPSPCQPGRIPSVTVSTNMGSGFGTNIQNTVNGMGLSSLSLAAPHAATIPSNSWVSAGTITGTVTFNLGGTFAVDSFSFWNQNGGGPGANGSTGIQGVAVSTSTDGITFSPLSGGPTAFAQVMPNAAAPPQIFNFTPVSARFFRFTILSNYGDTSTGFGEAGFNTAACTPTPTPTPGGTTVTRSFTGPAMSIPDNNATGLNITLPVSGVGTFLDLNFRVDGTASSADPNSISVGVNHSWLGDLRFRLTSPSGTSITLFNRPTSGGGACSGNNMFNMTLDDEGGSPSVDSQCPPGDNAGPLTGTFSPSSALSAFDGQNANGNWVLNVSDNATQDTGFIRAFSLVFTVTGGTTTPTPTPVATPTPTPTPGPTPNPNELIVISQIYGGGGAAGATYRNSFVEIFNRGSVAVNLNNWEYSVFNGTGGFNIRFAFSNPSGQLLIQPGQYRLIRLGSGGSNGIVLPAPDFDISTAQGSGLGVVGKLAVARPGTGNLAVCPLSNPGLIEFVGFGPTNCFEGSGPTGNLSVTTAAIRSGNGCTDTNNNASDFTVGAPNPRNGASPLTPCAGATPTPTPTPTPPPTPTPTPTPTPVPGVRATAFDYDADGRADISIFRESLGDWYLQGSTAGFSAFRFGFGTDRIVPADYDGDRRTDIAVYRPSAGAWFILNTATATFSTVQFGLADDLPTPADFDGDGKADIGVYRPSSGTWFRNNSSNGQFVAFPFGLAGDKPVPQDFDGDGRADYGVYRPSNGIWFQQLSATNTFYGEGFGAVGDQIVPGDYDGDRKADLAVYRASTGQWFIKSSVSGNFTATTFGNATDQPAAADYDGDGRFDICVFRGSEGQWYRLNSSNGQFNAFPFGLPGDRPTHSAFY